MLHIPRDHTAQVQKQKTINELIQMLEAWICTNEQDEPFNLMGENNSDTIEQRFRQLMIIAGIQLGTHRIGFTETEVLVAIAKKPKMLLAKAINRAIPARRATAQHLFYSMTIAMQSDETTDDDTRTLKSYLRRTCEPIRSIPDDKVTPTQFEMLTYIDSIITDTPPVSPPAPAMRSMSLPKLLF